MSKLIRVAWIAVLLFPVARAQKDHFSKYKAVEAYEIRPGILMMPRYTDDGSVCEIGLEPLRYTRKEIEAKNFLSRQTIDQIVDELAPAAERGPNTTQFGGDEILYSGVNAWTNVYYENVSVQMVNRGGPYKIVRRHVSRKSQGASDPSEYIAVVIRWKNRQCRTTP
jgi:hypothetical protein